MTKVSCVIRRLGRVGCGHLRVIVNVIGSGSMDKMLSVLPRGTICCFAGTDIGETLPRTRLRRVKTSTKLRKGTCPSIRSTMGTTRRGDLPRSLVFMKNDDFVMTSLLSYHSTLSLSWNVFERNFRNGDQADKGYAIGVDYMCSIRSNGRERVLRRGYYFCGIYRYRANDLGSVFCVLR